MTNTNFSLISFFLLLILTFGNSLLSRAFNHRFNHRIKKLDEPIINRMMIESVCKGHKIIWMAKHNCVPVNFIKSSIILCHSVAHFLACFRALHSCSVLYTQLYLKIKPKWRFIWKNVKKIKRETRDYSTSMFMHVKNEMIKTFSISFSIPFWFFPPFLCGSLTL